VRLAAALVARRGSRVTTYYWRAVTLSCVFTMTATALARAQDFVSPLVAIDFGSNSACVNVVLCAERHVAAGAAGGRLGETLGFEEEVVYANDFFGNAPNLSSSILTVMTNGVLLCTVGAWRVYGVGGLGLMATRIQFTESSLFATDRNSLAWDAGGGGLIFFSKRFGVDFDVRYIRAVREVPLSGFTVSDPKLGFGRARTALLVRF